MLPLRRSVRLAAWGTAALRGEVPLAEAVRRVVTEDEPHRIEDAARLVLGRRTDAADPDGGFPPAGAAVDPLDALLGPAGLGGPDLSNLLGALKARGVLGLRVVLPAPGDPSGLPGPAAFNIAAVEAAEAVLAEPGTGPESLGDPAWLGFVPEVTVFGSEWEPGAMVNWRVFPVAARTAPDPGSLAEAERELREALREATEALAALDVARWRPDAAGRIALLRDGGLPAGALPPSAPQRSAGVLATAARVQAIVELAREDDGGAVSGHEALMRAQALRRLEQVSRRAVAAAVNASLDPH